ncbi:MAG: hypothetical protein DRP88_01140 [Candidatus Neomarinimicrobiota bacterium]|nr:MAG: hypothetical protein DRP88_01140 [Candidatus Neomarinimicrobiota bacterium]
MNFPLVKRFFLLWIFLVFVIPKVMAENFLSNLEADKNSPIYTTYAASMERSEFVVDEGYHFLFYDTSRALLFDTDKAGDIGLLFVKDGEIKYKVGEFYKEPVITLSYPDMVRFYFYPYENIRVDCFFFVYSSHYAIYEVKLTNEGNKSTEIKIIPFIQNDYRDFFNVDYRDSENCIFFWHDEFPDDWVMSHNIPYETPLADIFFSSVKPSRLTGYLGFYWYDTEVSQQVFLDKKPTYVLWGRIKHSDGSVCRHEEGKAAVFVKIKGRDEILNEKAPVFGRATEVVNDYGYYNIDLGGFKGIEKGDIYTLKVYCPVRNEIVSITDTVGEVGDKYVRKDINLMPVESEEIRVIADKDIWGSGKEVRLFWKSKKYNRFNIYRRDYSAGEGTYKLISKDCEKEFYTDKNIPTGKIYGYVVVPVNDNGEEVFPSQEVNNVFGSDFITDVKYPDQLNNRIKGNAKVVAMEFELELSPGEMQDFRLVRGVERIDVGVDESMLKEAKYLAGIEFSDYIYRNETLFSKLYDPTNLDQEKRMLYWSSFNLMRQVMLPPEGKCSFNYYVFSREPTWGWGHGGQVFHESITMLAYVFLDPISAMNSQRVYLERQWEDGYINYRTGPYLDETIPYNGQYTTSAPWYSWENWEIYKVTRDKKFLSEMYESGKKFYNYYVQHRDSDGDGLCEWGAHAILESVRDALVAVWDQVGWPSNFESLDLNCMLVMEARCLSKMAEELGLDEEVENWKKEAEKRAELINRYMWDEETGFYYNVDKKDNDFSFRRENDLKRMEIIGFLPMWAGVCDSNQAERLVEVLTNTDKFWRKFGVPSLSADDPYYNPHGYWNGPVWVEWDYLVFYGLRRYGYNDIARELVEKVARNMIEELKKNHQLWEFYSPDDQWAGYHRQYIWAGIIARMIRDAFCSSEVMINDGWGKNSNHREIETVCYPNPSNSTLSINFCLPEGGDVSLSIYDILGRKVKTLFSGYKTEGQHRLAWDGRNESEEQVSAGMYLLKLSYQGAVSVRKILLVY